MAYLHNPSQSYSLGFNNGHLSYHVDYKMRGLITSQLIRFIDAQWNDIFSIQYGEMASSSLEDGRSYHRLDHS